MISTRGCVIFVAIIILSYFSRASHAQTEADLLSEAAKIWEVVDGDTIDIVMADEDFLLANVQRVRVAGMQAMEVGKESGDQDDCHGDEAEVRLAQLLGNPIEGDAGNGNVSLRALDLAASSRGRLLRYVFFDGGDGEFDAGRKLVKEGYALAFPQQTETVYNVPYLLDQNIAINNGLNIWDEDDCSVGPNAGAALEIYANYDADGEDDNNLNGEYIVVINNSGSSIDMENWSVRDSGLNIYLFAAGVTLPANGGSLSVFIGSGTDTANEFYWGLAEPIFENEVGDGVFLLDPDIDTNSGDDIHPTGDIRAYFLYPCLENCTSALTGVLEISAFYNPDGEDMPNGEVIYIENTSAGTADLSRVLITSAPSGSASYLFNEGTSLTAGETISLFIGEGTDSGNSYFWGNATAILANESDLVAITTLDQIDIDSFQWPCVSSCVSGLEGKIELSAIYNPDGVDDDNLNGEKVYIDNISDSAIDLSGLLLSSDPSGSATYVFDNGVTLAAGARLELRIGSGTDSSLVKYWGKSSAILGNTSDAVRLSTLDQIEIASFAWICSGICTHPLKGRVAISANYDAQGVDSDNINGEWVVIQNISDSSIDLKDTLLRTTQAAVLSYQFIDSTPLNAGQRLVVYVGDGSNTAFEKYWRQGSDILANSGDGVELVSYDGITIARHNWPCGILGCEDGYGVEIIGVKYDAEGSDTTNPNGEFFVLKNITEDDINLVDWKFVIGGKHYNFEDNFILDGNKEVTVFIGSGDNNSGEIFLGYSSGILSNAGATINLYSQYRDLLSCIDWVEQAGTCGVSSDVDADGVVDSRDFDIDGDGFSNAFEQRIGSDPESDAGDILRSDASEAVASCDFNNDGFADFVIGAPGRAINGRTDAGGITVRYGSADGLIFESTESFNQGKAGLSGTAEKGDRFGNALAVGDLNGDDYCDLVVGVNGEALGSKSKAGMAHIIYGDSSGLSTVASATLHQDTSGIKGVAEAYDEFAYALAIGDFDGDGFDDLAVGAPGEDVGSLIDAGAMHIIYGASGGLTSRDRLIHQDSKYVVGKAEAGDRFGNALSAGDFNNDSLDDLVVGIVGEAVGVLTEAGAVQVFKGKNSGLTAAGDKIYHQDTSGVRGKAEAGDEFGYSVLAGDINGDGHADLIVGAPGEALGSLNNAGAVHVLLGSSSGLTASGDQAWSQDSSGVNGTAEKDDRFGEALATADFNNDNRVDLFIGAPGEAIGSKTKAGMVHLLFGGDSGLSSVGDKSWHQNSSGINGSAETNDKFGGSLTTGDYDNDGYDDVLIGIPGENIGSAIDSGDTQLLFGEM
jgi:endonuclease YncB( thermonuclease family)